MAEMTRSTSVAVLAPEFDDFLFASIDEDRNGMMLSVVSALARLDVDPWQEAANLAQLPGVTATRRLASLIAALPDRPSAHLDHGAIAARLIARLPRRAGLNAPVGRNIARFSVPAVMQSPPFRYAALALLAIVLGGLTYAASQRPAVRVSNADAPAASTVSPATSPPNSSQ
jgi:hypothetical protein